MTRFSVLLSTAALVLAIAAVSATGSGIRDAVDDVVDPALTDEVEAMLERSVLREYAGLGDPTPIPPAPVPVDRIPTEVTSGVPTGIPAGGVAHVGAVFVEDGYLPLTDLDALYGVYGYSLPAAAAPAHVEPPADLVDDTPTMIASAWSNPPLDIK